MDDKLIIDNNDGFNWTLSKQLSDYTQEELAHELIEYKRTTNIDPTIRIGNEMLTTKDLNDEKEFLDKYKYVLDRAHMPKTEEDLRPKTRIIPLSRIVTDYKQEELAEMLIDAKKENNQECGVQINSKIYDTNSCETVEDFIDKYSKDLTENGIKSIEVELDVETTKVLKTQIGNFNRYLFRLDRGNINNDGIDINAVSKMEEEYTKIFAKKDSINFSNSKEVYDWLNELVPYINTHAVSLGNNSVDYILAIMNERGYTKAIFNNDEYKKAVYSKLRLLEKYNFFVLDRVNNEYDSADTKVEAVKLEIEYLDNLIKKYQEKGLENINYHIEELNSDVDKKLDTTTDVDVKAKLLVEKENKLKVYESQKEAILANIDKINVRKNALIAKFNIPVVEEEQVEEELSNTKKLRLLDKLKNAINTTEEDNKVVEENNEPVELDFSFPDTDTLDNFTPIKSIRSITKELYDKINTSRFKKVLKEAVEKMNLHKKAVIAGFTFTIGLASINVGVTNANTDVKIEAGIEQIVPNNETALADSINEEVKETKKITLDEASMYAKDDVIEGNRDLYTSSDNAIKEENGIVSEHLDMHTVQNATLGSYYKLENGVPEQISKEEALELYENGQSLAQTLDNNGQTIGFVTVEDRTR